MEEVEFTTTMATTAADLDNPFNGEPPDIFDEDMDSTCSTPYVSAPSSPIHGPDIATGFYYSAPASPVHFMLSTTSTSINCSTAEGSTKTTHVMPCSFEFDFSSRLSSTHGLASAGSMSSADELFLNGEIRPMMKLSTNFQIPHQALAPLLDLHNETNDLYDHEINVDNNGSQEEVVGRGRDLKFRRDRSLRRRTRSMSPLRTTSFHWDDDDDDQERKSTKQRLSTDETKCDVEAGKQTETPSSSRSTSKKWVLLKEFMYRSKSEGRANGHKFWSSFSLSPAKEKKMEKISAPTGPSNAAAAAAGDLKKKVVMKQSVKEQNYKKPMTNGKLANGIGKRRIPTPSPHELNYMAYKAQAEEMRKKTFLPYRQGLLGCLGFGSKSYGAMNGFARALNPVSSS